MRSITLRPDIYPEASYDVCGDSVMVVSKNGCIPIHLATGFGVLLPPPFLRFDDDTVDTPLELNTVYRRQIFRRLTIGTPFGNDGITEFEMLIGENRQFPLMSLRPAPLHYHYYREESDVTPTQLLYPAVSTTAKWYKNVKRLSCSLKETLQSYIVNTNAGDYKPVTVVPIVASVLDATHIDITANLALQITVPSSGWPAGTITTYPLNCSGLCGANPLTIAMPAISIPVGALSGGLQKITITCPIHATYTPAEAPAFPKVASLTPTTGTAVTFDFTGTAPTTVSDFALDVYAHQSSSPLQSPMQKYTNVAVSGTIYNGFSRPYNHKLFMVRYANLSSILNPRITLSMMGEIDA